MSVIFRNIKKYFYLEYTSYSKWKIKNTKSELNLNGSTKAFLTFKDNVKFQTLI